MKLYKSWNVMVRQVLNLDRCPHRYFIEHVSSHLHPKIMLASRYIMFYKSLVNSSKLCVRFLSRLNENDKRTVLGKTLQRIMDECELSDQQSRLSLLSSSLVKRKMKYYRVPEKEVCQMHLMDDTWEQLGFK